MKPNKTLIAAILLGITLVVAFGLPKPKYKSTDMLSQLNIPLGLTSFRGVDVSDQLNTSQEQYKFISKVLARDYSDEFGDGLRLMVLDAGNFHNPRICFSGSGFSLRELPQAEFRLPNKTLKAPVLLFGKKEEGVLVIYWMVINGKQVDWTQQKIQEFLFALFNKPKTGLMVRLDIPIKSGNTSRYLTNAQLFLSDLGSILSPDEQEMLFGK